MFLFENSPLAVHSQALHWVIRHCFFLCLFVLGGVQGEVRAQSAGSQPFNVLLLCVDDLRPELGCFGRTHMVTPHIDRLAQEGRLFTRHYVQVPTCGASRYALLTGRRPDTVKSLSNWAFDQLRSKEKNQSLAPGAPTTLPRHFKLNGYQTICIGKVSHQPDGLNYLKEKEEGAGDPEVPAAWDKVVRASGRWKSGWNAFFGYQDGSARERGQSPATERSLEKNGDYPDDLIAQAAIQELKSLKKKSKKPFFLAVGFYKPHLPFTAPDEYWKLYDSKKLPEIEVPDVPLGSDPKITLHSSSEVLKNYGQHPPKGIQDSEYVQKLRQAYFACVSYVDDQIGRVLSELKKQKLDRNTIVVLWGDHGWHLGEQAVFGKHTLFERSLHSPLIIRVPGMKQPGVGTREIVESVDVFPTLNELCQLPKIQQLSGKSLVSKLDEPLGISAAMARGYFRRGNRVGYTLRSDGFRVTHWYRGRELISQELYDHRQFDYEKKNKYLELREHYERLKEKLPLPFHFK